MINVVLILLPIFLVLGQLLRLELLQPLVFYPHDGILAVLWVLVLMHQHRRSNFALLIKKIPKMVWLTLAWFGLAAGIHLLTQQELLSLAYLARFAWYVLSLLLVASLLPKRSLLVIWMLSVSGALFAMVSLVLFALFPDLRALTWLGWDDHYYRLAGTMLDPNFTGIILLGSWLAWLLTWRIDHRLKPSRQQLSLILSGSLLFGATLGLTFSRSSYLAAWVAVLLLGMASVAKRWPKKQLLGAIGVFSIAAVMAVIITPKPGGEGVNLTRTYSFTSRQTHDATQALQPFVSANPLSLVIGPGLLSVSSAIAATDIPQHASLPNNLFVTWWVLGGGIGLLLGVITLMYLLRIGWQIQPILSVYLVVLLVHTQFNASLTEPFVVLLVGTQLVTGLFINRKHFFIGDNESETRS